MILPGSLHLSLQTKLFVHPTISLIYVYDRYQNEPFCYVKKSDGKVI